MIKPKILVTGSKGQLGNAIQDLSNKYIELDFYYTSKQELDITNIKALDTFFSKHHFDYCINTAAYTKVDQAEVESELCFRINEDGVKNLAEICKKNQTILIHISSDYVYHPPHVLFNKETDNTNPQGIYAQSKLAGEQQLIKILERHIIIRTSWVYYKTGHNFVNTMLRLAGSNQKLRIVADQYGSPTYAADLAKAIFHMIKKTYNNTSFRDFGIFNFSNEGITNWADFAKTIFEIKNLTVEVDEIPSTAYPTPANRPLNSRLSKEKICSTFDIQLKHWKKALEESLKDIK